MEVESLVVVEMMAVAGVVMMAVVGMEAVGMVVMTVVDVRVEAKAEVMLVVGTRAVTGYLVAVQRGAVVEEGEKVVVRTAVNGVAMGSVEVGMMRWCQLYTTLDQQCIC